MIRVCVDARMINNSGIGVYIRKYIECLLDEVSIDLTLMGRKVELISHLGLLSSWHHIETDIPIYSIQEQIRLPLLIPPCDVFWSPHYNIPLLPIRAKFFLVTIPDVFHLAFYKTLSASQRIYAKVVTNAAVRKSDRILTISDYSKKEIVRFTGIQENKIQVIYLGLDRKLFHPIGAIAVQQAVRMRYQIPRKYILFVGNVKPNKNLRALVNAFSLLLEKLPEHKLLIVGKKDGFINGDTKLFKRIAAEPLLHDRVAFTGYVDLNDLPVLYSIASVFAFPSLYEGFGFPPLEAMACGCPVVASDRASIPEISGEAAVYVNPDDPDILADALYQVITDDLLRKSLIEKGYAQIERYNWAESGRQFIREIHSLIK